MQRRQRQWLSRGEPGISTPKPELHLRKVMLSFTWATTSTVTSDVYCRQLGYVDLALRGKQDKIFPHDSARPHVAKLTQKEIPVFRISCSSPPTVFAGPGPSRNQLQEMIRSNLKCA
ncbi:hypothetical protein OESDEN_15110 [Oesophagostomum dentatum]|uniref:Uncharacterized protein n=1 Tax=Oesophagostomum dentatum TaxID=61180 RepID=A0A0B1SIN2_OESDE|nr:hypothetical protein OESDEN_15110 [Oesophagostomum dentatum]